MIVELTAVRLVAPFFGSSMDVWSTIIALIMAALALGYFLGGQLSQKTKNQDQAVFLILAVAGIFIGLSYRLVEPIVSFASVSLYLSKAPISLKTSLVIFTLFFLPVLLLGSIYPLMINFLKRGQKAGPISGKIFAISTAGSILGTLLPAFVLIPIIGTKATFLITGILLEILAAIGTKGLKKLIPLFSLLVLLFFGRHFFSPAQNPILDPNTIYYKESSYQEIRVKKYENQYFLYLGHSPYISSIYDPDSIFTDDVFDYLALIPLFLEKSENLDVLIIGLGAGTVSDKLDRLYSSTYSLSIDGVEIDPEVVKVGKKFFNLARTCLNIFEMDGRTFLRETQKKYDLIIADAYARQAYVPFHLATREFFLLAKNHLKDKGVLAMNIAGPQNTYRYNALSQTIKSAFEFAYLFSPEDINQTNNIIIAANIPLDTKNPFVQEIPPQLKNLAGVVSRTRLKPISLTDPSLILNDDKAKERI